MVKIVKCALAAVLASLPVAAFAAWELNMPVGVTELRRRIHALHMLIFWVCVVIAVAVFGAMIYSIVKFRRSQGGKAKTDRIDARALARFVAVSNPAATPQPDATLAGLRELTRFRAELVGDRTVAINRLHGALDLAFPELPTLLGRLNTGTTLALLAAYPTAASVAEADRDAVLVLVR